MTGDVLCSAKMVPAPDWDGWTCPACGAVRSGAEVVEAGWHNEHKRPGAETREKR